MKLKNFINKLLNKKKQPIIGGKTIKNIIQDDIKKNKKQNENK